MVLASGSVGPPVCFGFTAIQVAQMFLALSSCVALAAETRELARIARDKYSGRVDGQLLAMLDLANLKNDLTRDDFRPLDMHYRELELAIYRYRPTESPTSALQQPSGSGPPDAGSMQVLPREPPHFVLSVCAPIWAR